MAGRGTMLGVGFHRNQDMVTAVQDFEARIGRPVKLTRHYVRWHEDLAADPFLGWAVSSGHTPFVNLEAFDEHGDPCSTWDRVVAGAEDHRLRHHFRALAALGVDVVFCFHHEPENEAATIGPGPRYRQAWAYARTFARDLGVRNLIWTPVFMHSTYNGNNGGIDAWLPHEDTYHWLGSDGYNRGSCQDTARWDSFADCYSIAHDLAGTLGKRLFIGEWGCVEATDCDGTSSHTKAQWFVDAKKTIRDWNVAGAVYSNVVAKFPNDGRYTVDYRIQSSPTAEQSFATTVGDPQVWAL